MARPEKFSADAILDATMIAALNHGSSVTLGHISAEISAPTGSLYHRFASREELLGSLWLRSISRLHAAMHAAAANNPRPREALVSIAITVVRYAREHPAEAASMRLFRQDYLATAGPTSLRERAARINESIWTEIERLAVLEFGQLTPQTRDIVRAAVTQVPYGLVRPYIGGDIPGWLDEATEQTTLTLLALASREP